ncbi:MAG: hypothetical protein R3199_03605 [Gemmatimonadota bacterium]|nr:hypothetical protein [Gemmatimonadota bacterium]
MSGDADPGRRRARTLIGGVGYADLRDFSVGRSIVRRLAVEPWPGHVAVEDQSHYPVDEVHRFDAAHPPFDRWILVGAVRRGRVPGSVTAYRWDGSLPDPEEIQERVAEAMTGVISLENLLVVVGALGSPPEEVCVIEIEPGVEAMGSELSPAVEAGAVEAGALVRALALAPPGEMRAPTAPLGGRTTTNGRPVRGPRGDS